jgi:hypothetical protein
MADVMVEIGFRLVVGRRKDGHVRSLSVEPYLDCLDSYHRLQRVHRYHIQDLLQASVS